MSGRYEQIVSELKDIKVGEYLGCYYASDHECKGVIEGFAANALQKGHKLITFANGHVSPDIPEPGTPGETEPASSRITCISSFADQDIPADADALIDFLNSETNRVLGSTWKGVRICLDMSSLPVQVLSNGSFKSFMGRLLSLNRSESCIILFLYDMEKTAPDVLMESLSIYPRVIIGERLIDNTYFVPGGLADVRSLMHGAVKECLEGLVRGERFRREIRDLEDKYRFVFENTSDFMFLHDMEGFIREMKLVDEVVEGYTEKDLLRLNLRDLIPARVRHEFDDYLKKIRAEGKSEGIIRLLSRNGGERIFEYKSFLISGESGPAGARGIARDITERFNAREALVKSEEKYRDLFNRISDYVFTHDLEGNFDFEETNDKMKQSLGYRGEVNRYSSIRDFIPDKYKPLFPEYLRRIKEKGKDKGFLSVIHVDGSEHILEYRNSLIYEGGAPAGIRGIANDITDRIKGEKQLKRSEQRYRDIFNNVSDYLYFHDLEGYFRYDECNNTVRDNWKGMRDSQGRTNLRDIMPERFRPQLDQYLKRIIRKGQDEGPLCIIDKEGAERILEYRNTLTYDKEGNPFGVRGSARDITDRIHAEKQLKKSEEKYRTILDSIEEGYYEVDLKGRFTFGNESLFRILGTTSPELLGTDYSSFMDDRLAQDIFRSFNEVFKSQKDKPTTEWEFIRRSDRRKIYLEGSVIRILDKDGRCTGFRGMIRDVTHRVQSEHALIESEHRYRNIFNNVSDFLYFHDLDGNFDFEETNAQARHAWGYREKVNRRMNLIDLIPERHKPFFGEYLKRIREKSLDEGLLTVIFATDGKEHIIEYKNLLVTKNGVPTGVQGSARDVTDRIHAQRQLEKSEEKYRTILESIEEGYYEVNLGGSFVFVNDSFCRITCAPKEELIGSNFSRFTDEDNAKAVFDTYNMVFKTGKDLESVEFEFIRNDGEKKYVELSISRMLSRAGECKGFRGIIRDVTKRIQVEHKLKESEFRYRTILESIEEGYYEVDLEGSFSFFNDSLCRILGCTYEELVGMNYSSFVGEDTARGIFKTFNAVFTTGRDVESVEWEFFRKSDGEQIFIEVSVSRVLDMSGELSGFRGIVRDVTKRVKAERALMESEHRYRLLAENVNDIIWTSDIDFNFTYVSPSVKQVARATVEDTLKLNFRHVMNRGLFRQIVAEFDEIMARAEQGEDISRVVKRFEFEHTRGDGTTFWADTVASIQLDDSRKPVGFVGITRDITDRINAEEEIRKNEAKYRSILESIEEGYYETDLRGRLTFFNDSLCRNMGFRAEEIEGRSYRIFMDDEGARAVVQTFRRVLETGKPEKAFGWTLIRKDGRKVLTETSILLIRDSMGNPLGFRGLIRDVSERVQTEEFKAAKLKAEAENRAKSEFLANMSHEIRTPLNGIIGMTELAMDTSLDDNQRDIVRVINRESEILLNLINDVLDFSKIEADRYELEEIPFDLRVLVEDLAHSFAMRSEKKGLEFISFISPDVPSRLMGDPGRLRQVIANLAGNSLKFTDRGEIFIKVEKIREYKNRVSLRFSVRDTGIGIPKDKQERIFESFTQADGSTTRKYGGTGLGLAISKKIVEMMGGKIGVKSMKGEGSTFFFTAGFPKQKDQRIYPVLDEVDIKGMRVLVVDDNETNRFILKEYLKTWGCLPVDYPGGPETVALLMSGVVLNEPFDLILMDFNMPDLNGFELTKEIRAVKSLKKVPIIILTSLGDLGDGKHCKDIGIQGYLPKPMRRDDLKKAILSVLGISKAEEAEETSKLITRHTVVEDSRNDIQILLAEDYPTNQQVAMRHLFKAGYQAEIAENGQQALAAFKRKRYDLILMDIQMPIMDGYEATKQIRKWEEKLASGLPPEDRKRIPIIAMTAHAITGYRDKCIEAGMDDYIAKPLRREELIEMVDRWTKSKDVTRDGSIVQMQPEQGKGDKPMEKKECPIDLERVMNEFDADREFLKDILGGFLQNVGRQIEIIRKAIGQGDAETVRKEAHSIKGGAANICADDLSSTAMELENLGKSGKVDGGMEILRRMEQEYKRLDVFDKTEL